MPDKLAIQVQFLRAHKRWPNLSRPKTLNEKICWRKLNQRNPDFTAFADKVQAKVRVADLIGGEYIIPTLWVGASPKEIPFDDLKAPYVIKVNHSSGGNIFVRLGQKADRKGILENLENQLKYDHGYRFREWGYLNIPKNIIVEPIVGDLSEGESLDDYKFFVYHGRVHFVLLDVGRFVKHERGVFDRDWRLQPAVWLYPVPSRAMPKPKHFELLISLAEKIGSQFDFVRVDFYDLPEGPLFGEATFYPGAGLEVFESEDWDLRFGEPWRLPGRASGPARHPGEEVAIATRATPARGAAQAP